MNEQAEILTEKIAKMCKQNKTIDVSHIIQMMTLDVILGKFLTWENKNYV